MGVAARLGGSGEARPTAADEPRGTGETDRERTARRQRRSVEAEAEIAAGVMTIGEIGRRGGRLGDPRDRTAHGDAELVVAGGERQGLDPSRTDQEDEGEEYRPQAGEPAQGGQPSSSRTYRGHGTFTSLRSRRRDRYGSHLTPSPAIAP